MNDLEDLEMLANGGGSTPAASVTPSSPLPVTSSSPRESGDNNRVTLKERALQGLPPEWRERAIRDAGECGVRHDNDVGWLLIGSTVQTLFCAFAAGDAARAVQASVNKIQGQIFQGAIKAGDEIKGALGKEIEDKLGEGGRVLVQAITIAADAGSTKIQAGALDLTVKLDQAIEAKKAEGVDQFAKAAALAAGKAAAGAGAKRFLWSTTGVAFLLIVFVGIGAILDHEYLSLSHKIAPHSFVLNQFGKPNCGIINAPGGGGKEEVCEIQ